MSSGSVTPTGRGSDSSGEGGNYQYGSIKQGWHPYLAVGSSDRVGDSSDRLSDMVFSLRGTWPDGSVPTISRPTTLRLITPAQPRPQAQYSAISEAPTAIQQIRSKIESGDEMQTDADTRASLLAALPSPWASHCSSLPRLVIHGLDKSHHHLKVQHDKVSGPKGQDLIRQRISCWYPGSQGDFATNEVPYETSPVGTTFGTEVLLDRYFPDDGKHYPVTYGRFCNAVPGSTGLKDLELNSIRLPIDPSGEHCPAGFRGRDMSVKAHVVQYSYPKYHKPTFGRPDNSQAESSHSVNQIPRGLPRTGDGEWVYPSEPLAQDEVYVQDAGSVAQNGSATDRQWLSDCRWQSGACGGVLYE